MAPPLREPIQYPETLAAVGRLLAQKQLQDVCVMEFEDGMIVTGSVLYESGGHLRRTLQTFVLSQDDLRKMKGGR